MKRKRFTEEQIMYDLRQAENGTPVAEICRKLGVTEQSFYRWKRKYQGMGITELRRLKQLEKENRELKKLVADLSLDKQMLQDVLKKKPLKPARGRDMVDYLRAGYDVSTRQACQVIQLARRSYYYQSTADPQTALRIRLRDLAKSRVSYGYRRLHVLLRREGWMITPKRVYRLYCEEGLGLRTKRPRRRRSVVPRVSLPEPTGPTQIWSMDFVSDELGWGRRFRVLTLVDHFSRVSPALEVGVRMSGQRVADVLNRLSMSVGVPALIRVDNGPEFTSKALDQWAYRNGVHLDFIRPGKPVENAFIESFNASFRKECLNSHWFQTLDEAKLTIEQWRKEYNRNRPHSSLGNMTPREYAEKHDQPEASETEILTLKAVQ